MLLAAGVGGAVGTMARWGVFEFASHLGSSPWAVLILVNVTGSFALGWLLSSAWAHGLSTRHMAFLTTGVLGSFTTFSGFTVETVEGVRAGRVLLPLAFVGVSIAAGIVAVFAGRVVAARS